MYLVTHSAFEAIGERHDTVVAVFQKLGEARAYAENATLDKPDIEGRLYVWALTGSVEAVTSTVWHDPPLPPAPTPPPSSLSDNIIPLK